MGIVFNHLATHVSNGPSVDNSILVLLGVLWPVLENVFQSEHIENSSLSAAACRALSQAIKSSGIVFFNFLDVGDTSYILVASGLNQLHLRSRVICQVEAALGSQLEMHGLHAMQRINMKNILKKKK